MVADIVEGTGVGEIVVQSGIAQPAWSPHLAGIPAERRDPRGVWAPTRMSYFAAAYNTKLVPTGTQPKTYDELLDPKWQGKIAWPLTSASAGVGGCAFCAGVNTSSSSSGSGMPTSCCAHCRLILKPIPTSAGKFSAKALMSSGSCSWNANFGQRRSPSVRPLSIAMG